MRMSMVILPPSSIILIAGGYRLLIALLAETVMTMGMMLIMMYTGRLALHSVLVKRVMVLEKRGKEEGGGNFDEQTQSRNSKPFQCQGWL